MGSNENQLLEGRPSSVKRRSKGLLLRNICNNNTKRKKNEGGVRVRFDEKLSAERVIVDPCTLKMKQKAGVWYRFEHLQMFKKDIKKTILNSRKKGAFCFATTKRVQANHVNANDNDNKPQQEEEEEEEEEEESCLRGIEHLYSTEISRRIKKMKKSHVIRVLTAQNRLRKEGLDDPDGSYLRMTSLESSEEFSFKAQMFGEQDSDEAFSIYCEESEIQQQQQLLLHEQLQQQLNIGEEGNVEL